MRTYQIILKGGLTRLVQADRYKTHHHHLVFLLDGRAVSRFDNSSVIMVDEIPGVAGPEAPQREPHWDCA